MYIKRPFPENVLCCADSKQTIRVLFSVFLLFNTTPGDILIPLDEMI